MALVETGSRPVRRLIVKGPAAAGWSRDMRTERFARETWLLTEIAPRIAAKNPRARCPAVLAADPDRQVLLLEMVPGNSLKSRLFGVGRVARPDDTAALLRLCGEWLAQFHALTRSPEDGNPFDWVIARLDVEWTRWVFERYAGHDAFSEMCALAQRARGRYADFRRPLCWVHGLFGPHHVLVHEGSIYVIDLESSHLGYPYEDLAFFSTSQEMFVPWRRGLGTWRMKATERHEIFVAGYFGHAVSLTPPEAVIMRFARLLALVRFLGSPASGNCLIDPHSRIHPLRYRLLRRWWKRQIRAISQREFRALREACGGTSRSD